MKKIIIYTFCLFLLLFSNRIIAQKKTDDVGIISLAVIMPDNSDELSLSQLSKIESKIQKIITTNGLSGSGYNNNFVIYPKFEIYDESTVEGMRNIIVVQAEFNLFIKQVDNNMMFASYSKSIKGSGYTKEKAIKDAISKIPVKDLKIQEFIINGKKKIIHYYVENCDNIVKKADAFIQIKKYDQAIGLLMSIPEEITDCYDKVQKKSIEAYLAYQEQYCKEQMQLAQTSYNSNNYSQALYYLGQIDPSSSCNDNSIKLMNEIGKVVDQEEKKEWDFMMKRYSDSVSLEKSRIDAMKEVAKAYYKNKPQTVHYNYIVK